MSANTSDEPSLTDDAESQMRKALGLMGETPRHRPDTDRTEQPSRTTDRFSGGSSLHRRRFVQDGDVPVTVLRREQGHEAPVQRGAAIPAAAGSNRLQRVEAALATETAAREKAERLLAETQGVVRDLQTKIGHAELAKVEAIDALGRERDGIAQMRAEIATQHEQLQEALDQLRVTERSLHLCQGQLVEERNARKAMEKSLRSAEVARESAEQLVQALSADTSARQPVEAASRRARPVAEPEVAFAPTRRARPSEAAVEPEPEPVKWWLNTKPAGKRR